MKTKKGILLFISLLMTIFALHGSVYAQTADSWLLGDSTREAADEYDVFADQVLAAILTDGMTDVEQCRAIYDYVHAIPYVNVVYSEDWRENGYHMLFDRAGDCFGYYAASRLLLERLGYHVVELQNINGFKHVWCLVSIDDGQTWQHFDPTCWSWGSDGYLCLLSDDEMTDYGRRHQVGYNQLSHDWDRQQAAAEIEVSMAGQTARVIEGTDYPQAESVKVYLLYPDEELEDPVPAAEEDKGVSSSSVVTRRTRADGDSQG